MVMAIRVDRPVSLAPLAAFRIAFGALMLFAVLRTAANGWIESLYIAPRFHFSYVGLAWLQPLQGNGMYWLFALLAFCAAGVMLGAAYRLSSVGFFVLFNYVELLDQAYYLNHYYLAAALAFLLMISPLHRKWAVDAWLHPALRAETCGAWVLYALRVQVCLVYLYAGIAKLQTDWLLEGLPLRLWLPSRASTPILGAFLVQPCVAYIFSWAGALYDLTIWLWLLYPRTRKLALLVVIIFHLLTALIFPTIGIFPYLMLVGALLFLPQCGEGQHTPVLAPIGRLRGVLLCAFLVAQVLIPLRHWLYPSDVLWTEEGFRFSWRVMLIDKAADTTFLVRDKDSGAIWEVFPRQFLTNLQARQMAFQADMILQFAHFLARHYAAEGIAVEVRAVAYVSLNGRPSRLLIDPDVDLVQHTPSLLHKVWLLP